MHGALKIQGVPKAEGGSPKTALPGSSSNGQSDCGPVDVLRSGRWGDWVYYLRGNKQCRRRYVVPHDPRTPKQLRCRAALTAASKAWSQNPQLTPEDRRAWIESGAKAKSRVRLGQSGPLTGQTHFVGRNCAKGRTGLDMLLRPTAERATRPLSILPSAFFLLPRPTPRASPAKPRHCSHVDRLSAGGRFRIEIRSARPRVPRPCSETRWRGHRRARWRGG
jgi:hypothetical protein